MEICKRLNSDKENSAEEESKRARLETEKLEEIWNTRSDEKSDKKETKCHWGSGPDMCKWKILEQEVENKDSDQRSEGGLVISTVKILFYLIFILILNEFSGEITDG